MRLGLNDLELVQHFYGNFSMTKAFLIDYLDLPPCLCLYKSMLKHSSLPYDYGSNEIIYDTSFKITYHCIC